MFNDFKDILRCPACFGEFAFEEIEIRKSIIEDGSLVCKKCFLSYPIIDGVAYLAVIDDRWAMILKELIARREIVYRTVSQQKIEEDRQETKTQQYNDVGSLMDNLFNIAVGGIDFSKKPLILDVGAGDCITSKYMAEKGAIVFATDTEISNLTYLNFADLFEQPPQKITINNNEYYFRNPSPIKSYFSAIVCDVQRLPFADNSFDITMCRSVMHHIEKPSTAINEMLRVLKADGRLMLISEPVRALIDKEIHYLEGVYDWEEGLNEHCPTLLHYIVPMFKKTKNIEITYWLSPIKSMISKITSLFRYNLNKHYREGESISGFKMIKLLLKGASINLSAQKNSSEFDRPPIIKPDDLKYNILQIAEEYINFDSKNPLQSLKTNTNNLKKIRLDVLNKSDIEIPEHIDIKNCDLKLLESGWRELSSNFRYTMKNANILIGSPTKSSLILEMEISNIGLNSEVSGEIYFDTKQVYEFKLNDNKWHNIRINIENEKIFNTHILEITNNNLSKKITDTSSKKEYGIAVKKISVV